MDAKTLIAALQKNAERAATPAPATLIGVGQLLVRPLTVREASQIVQPDSEAEGDEHVRLARSCARMVCDAQGQRLFDPPPADVVDLFAAQPWGSLQQFISDAGRAGGWAGDEKN